MEPSISPLSLGSEDSFTSLDSVSLEGSSLSNRRLVYEEMKKAIERDRSTVRVSELSKLGLMQITRKRESYDQIMHGKYSEDLTIQHYFDVDSWMEAAGPCKKGKVFGLIQHICVSGSTSFVGASSTATLNRMTWPDDPLVMHQLKNDVQNMSSSLEMIQQILQIMTTLHLSVAPSSSAFEHLGSSKRNPAALPPLIPQFAP